MKIDVAAVRRLLKAFDFKTLFREQLGWDKYQAELVVPVDGTKFSLNAVAEKRGFAVFVCSTIPDRPTRLRLDRQTTKSAREHLIIYADQGRGEQLWEWVRREPGKPAASRDYRIGATQSGDLLIQKLEALAVDLEEEERLTIVDVAGRAKSAFDVDKITKRFYDRFKAEHAAFMKFIKGIKNDADLQWYTSLMLNRLMFVYFIQKKGFLDGDVHYLRNRMKSVQQQQGKNKFQSFYRYFLLRLFHEGLGQAAKDRKPELEKLLGKVPFLNGGFFEVHQLEENNPDIEIPDKAFEKLFDFFDAYNWHLDERPLRADNEINPDVVGYIFEKYINQKQMGAYYTKEDITEYISKNTIIPFLFDAAEKKCAIAFKADSSLWRMLQEDPDRYIYAAVRHGVIDDTGDVIPLPKEIAVGVKDVSKRDGWNKPARDPFALPTETWREHVARRQRCLEIREKLRRGEVHQINDLITLNLDIWQFARDAIVNSEGPELLRAFYYTIAGRIPRPNTNEKFARGISVLDPTCGSGAFLFAALRILETLYSDCLERMRRFVDELEQPGEKHRPEKYADFKTVLAEINEHPNERYFALKSIIINNLFGVDIMEEAVEICKLRLFLKLVAQVDRVEQIEPLPDIDFNIRAGNTLVGYVSLDEVRRSQEGQLGFGDKELKRIEEDALIADAAYKRFREQQVRRGGTVTAKDKADLRKKLNKLDTELDRYLAGEYGVKLDKGNGFDAWKASHQPFHWLVEFFGIMRDGGFDVIIGNPPYVNSKKVSGYSIRGFRCARCPDIYAWCMERVAQLGHKQFRTGMIVPLSLTFSGDFDILRRLLFTSFSSNWFSTFGRIPSALFSFDVRVRNTIHIGARSDTPSVSHSSRLHRWFDAERSVLFEQLSYARFTPPLWGHRIPKLGTTTVVDAFELLHKSSRARIGTAFVDQATSHGLYFKKTAYNWLNFCRTLPPCFDERGKPVAHTKFGEVWFPDETQRDLCFVLLNGTLEFLFWVAIGDDFDVTKWMFAEFPADISNMPQSMKKQLAAFARELDKAMTAAVSFKLNAGKRVGNFNLAKCRHITDHSDQLFLAACGLESCWEECQLLYTQVVRTSFESDDADEE